MYGPHLAECTEKNQAKAKSMLSHSRCTMWDTGRKKKKKEFHMLFIPKWNHTYQKKKLCLLGDVVPLQWQQMEVKLSLLRHDLP